MLPCLPTLIIVVCGLSNELVRELKRNRKQKDAVMEGRLIKIAEDSDFGKLKTLVDDNTNWTLEYNKSETKVWTQTVPGSDFKRVKVQANLSNVSPSILFDVLHDPAYRKEWDIHMIQSTDIGYLNPNNDVGYYAISCPAPLKNRDFVLQRSWLDTGEEKFILNHSVSHKNYPPKKGFVRATSHMTGYVIRTTSTGCLLGYITQTDPKGKLPSWLVNKITHTFAPKLVKQLRKAVEGYNDWKSTQKNPNLKPWTFPEQLLTTSKRIKAEDCVKSNRDSPSLLTCDSDEDD